MKPGVRPGFQLKRTKWERPSFRTVFPFSLPGLRQPERREWTNGRRGENQPDGWFSMSALGAQGNCASADALFFFILVDFRKAKIKKEFRACGLDQVPPGLASLRGWTAPGRRPGPTCRTLVLFALSAGIRIVAYGLRAGLVREMSFLLIGKSSVSRETPDG